MTSDTDSSIHITVLLFAAYREAVGQRSLSLRIAKDTTAADVFNLISSATPALEALRAYTSFAVNRALCPAESVLHDGDEVAFLQPASGGSHD